VSQNAQVGLTGQQAEPSHKAVYVPMEEVGARGLRSYYVDIKMDAS